MPSRRETAAGFTLMELMVVLAILGLMLALLPESLSVAVPGQRLRAAAHLLADDLRAARDDAMRSGRESVLSIDRADGSYRLGPSNAVHKLPPGTKIAVEEVPPRPAAASGEIAFFPDGSAAGGRISLTAAGRRYRVAVEWATGRISIDD